MKEEDYRQLKIATKFHQVEGRKKFYALRIKCIKYYARTNTLILASDLSAEVLFYSVELEKVTGKVCLEEILPSATAMIVTFHICESDSLLFITTTDKSIFVVELDPEKQGNKEKTLTISASPRTYFFFTPEIMVNMVFFASKDLLVGLTDHNHILVWHGAKRENQKPPDLRVQPKLMRIENFVADLNPQTLVMLPQTTWVVASDIKHNMVLVNVLKTDEMLVVPGRVTLHTMIYDAATNKIFAFGHEKVFWIYETSLYYKEVNSVCYHKAHVAVIVAAEQIPNRRVFITTDESNILKSWNMDTLETIQSFKLSEVSPITGLEHLGPQGFIVRSNLVYFMIFDDFHANYVSVLEDVDKAGRRQTESKNILVVPKIIVQQANPFHPQFVVATSTEIRSYQFEDGLLGVAYESKKLNFLHNRQPAFTDFDFLALPCSCIVSGLDDGSLVINPVNVDDPSSIKILNSQNKGTKDGRLVHVMANHRQARLTQVPEVLRRSRIQSEDCGHQ